MYISNLSALPSISFLAGESVSSKSSGLSEVQTYQNMLNSSTHIERKIMNEENSLNAEAMAESRNSQGSSNEISLSEAAINARKARNFLF